MPSADFGREILRDAVFKFASDTQNLRKDALEEIVLNSIYKVDGEVEENEIVSMLTHSASITLSPKEVRDTIERLNNKGSLISNKDSGDNCYCLSEEEEERTRRNLDSSENLREKVLDIIFRNRGVDGSNYESAFTDVISYAFAEPGEESVSMLQERNTEDSITGGSILEYCERIAENTEVDPSILKEAVVSFFERTEPCFNRIKWRYAQNFFIAKSVGIDYGDPAIGSEEFEGAVFYVDTNVAIPAVEPADRLSSSFELVHSMVSQLDAGFRICTRTIEELDDWANNEFDKAREALSRVPDEIFADSNSLFARIYERKVQNGSYDGPESLFVNFNNIEDILENERGISIERNRWFTDEDKYSKETNHLVDRVRSTSMKVRGKDKNREFQALHDALLIRWVIHQRDQGYNAWILTADTSLPKVDVPSHEGKSFAITIDSLLQWLSPTVINGENKESFVNVFSEAIKNRFFPQSTLYDLNELNVFAELGISVENLPKSDVDEALSLIKNKTGELDLSRAEDREELMGEVKKILSSPERESIKRS